MKISNIITAFFAMIITVALSACAGSGNINNPRASIYAGGQSGGGRGQVVSTTPSLETDFQGNPCVKGRGISLATSRAEIASNPRLRLVTDGSYAGRQVIMEDGAGKGNNIHNEFYTITSNEGIWVDEKGIPAYRDGCANRLGVIQAPVVATASIAQGNVPAVYVDQHQKNKTSWSLVLAPNLSVSTSGGYEGQGYGCNTGYYGYSRQPVCRTIQSRSYCNQQQPVCNNYQAPVQQYCPPPNPARAVNGYGGIVYHDSSRIHARLN